MNIRMYIEKLEEIEGNAKWLAGKLGMNVEVFVQDDYNIRIDNDEETKYFNDFGTIEELSEHIDAIAVGVMLAKGIEI